MDLIEGKYYLKELKTAQGYILNEECIPFEIKHEETNSDFLTVQVCDEPLLNEIKRVSI